MTYFDCSPIKSSLFSVKCGVRDDSKWEKKCLVYENELQPYILTQLSK